MPGHSTGANHKPPSHHTSRPRAGGYRHGRSCSRDSGTSQDSTGRDHHTNNNLLSSSSGSNHHNHNHNHNHHHNHNNHSHSHHHRSHNGSRKTHSRHTNGLGSETIGFIPGSADAAQGVPPACSSCTSLGWSSCKALICCILTCGFYGTREPCLPVKNESSTDNPTAKFVEAESRPLSNGMAVSNPTCGIPLETRKPSELPNSDSFRYKDVRIAGKKVHYQPGPTKRSHSAVKSGSHKERMSSIYSREDLDLDDIDDSGTDIDSLITKKLLELYKLHQIEQLAKCTSDSSFSRKTNEISDLIYSIAQDYNLEEQEAECRLVHGVIRISTRKGKNKNSYARNKDPSSQDALLHPNGQRDGTLPDSGHETMTLTFSSFEPEVKVSDLTPSDELARRMRVHSGRTYSSSSATVYSPTSHGTDFSGAPLLHSA